MDEKQIKELYDLISQKDSSFAIKMPYERFLEKMADDGYKGRIFGWMQGMDNSFNPQKFESKINVSEQQPQQAQVQQPVEPSSKKKDITASRSGEPFSDSYFAKPQVARDNTFVPRQFKPEFETPQQLKQQQEVQKRTQFIKPNLDIINENLINSTEGYVVPKMQYQFGDLGFKFEPSGVSGDWMTVTAPNGKKREFGLDPMMGFGAEKKAKELRTWMEKNIATIPEPQIKAIEEKYKKSPKFKTEEEVDIANKTVSKESELLKKDIDGFLKLKSTLEKEEIALSKATPEERQTQEYKQKVDDITKRKQDLFGSYQSISDRESALILKSAKLKQDVAKYTAMKQEQGGWLGGIQNWMIEGLTSMGETIPRRVINLTTELTPESVQIKDTQVQKDIIKKAKESGVSVPDFESNLKQAELEFKKLQQMPNATAEDKKAREAQLNKIKGLKSGFDKWYYSLPEDKRESFLDYAEDQMKKTALYGKDGKDGILKEMRKANMDVLGDDSVSLDWMKLKEKGFWGGAIAGLAKSAPALLLAKGGGGMAWAQRTANMFAQTSEAAYKEMEGPEFANVSENEKALVAAPIGIVGAVLESVGFRNVIGQKGLLNGLAARAMNRVGTNTTAKSFSRFVREDVESMMARGLLTLTAAGLAEFETGVAQQISDYAIKDIYSLIKDKKDANGNFMKMFDTPDSIGEWAIDVAKAGAQEAVGGFILGVPNSVAAAYRDVGFKGMDDLEFLTFRSMANDPKMQSAYIADLKTRILNGEITTDQAKETLNNYRESAGLFRSLPEGLDLQSQKEAMNLLRERKELETLIEGKDAALVTKQKARIQEINNELNKLSEDAVQELPTDESVLRTGQAGMGLSQMGEGNQPATAEGGQTTSVENAKPKVLQTVDNTSSALSSLPSDQKSSITFTDETGNEVAVEGNENRAATLYHEAVAVPEENRTESQQSVIDAVEVSLRSQIGQETETVLPEETTQEVQPSEGVSSKTQEQQQQEPATELDTILDQDVTNEEDRNKVLAFLDKLDSGLGKTLFSSANNVLLALPLSTLQVVVKGVKVLVQGGMMLRDAIKQVAADNNLSQPDVQSAMRIVESMSPIEQDYNTVMSKVDKMITRQRARGVSPERIALNVDALLRKQDVYINGTDAQRKIMEREGRNRVGVQQRRAPSIGRVLGSLRDFTTISRQEKIAIIREIRNLSKDAAKDLAKEIRAIAKKGKITTRQAANIIARFGKVNFLNERSVSGFVDYMSKVFKDAEYDNKLKVAQYFRKRISKLSKNKEKNAELRELAKKFGEINPSMVEDIDAYNSMAAKIKESLDGSKIRKPDEVIEADMVNIESAYVYTEDALAKQDAKLREEAAAEIQDLMGIDASSYSYEDMLAILRENKPITQLDKEVIRETLENAFDSYSSIIKEILRTGINPITGADFSLTPTQKRVISGFMAMDINELTDKEALRAIDSLKNFIENKSTSGMEAVVSSYMGVTNLNKVISKGISAVRLQKLFSPWLAKLLAEQTTNLGPLFERMFKGVTRGGYVEDASGLTKVKRGKAMAQYMTNALIKDYINEFYKQKANGDSFNSRFNNVERGMYAFLKRGIISDLSKQKKEFDRRRNLIKESIQVLSEGNANERQMAEVYQEVYESLGVESADFGWQLDSNIDPVNKAATDWWINEWAKLYPELSDVSLNIYNKVLGKDTYYSPDKMLKLSSSGERVDLVQNDASSFDYNNGTIYQRESSGLLEATRPESLPRQVSEDGRVGEVERYIDLSFDNNNANSMYDALVDIKTAAALRQVDAFINSPKFKKVIPEPGDRKILKDRIALYVRKIRNKAPFANDELTKSIRRLNNLAAIGVGQALGSVFQPLKQVVPVMGNTLLNGGSLDMGAIFNSSKARFINNSGYTVANRGVESQAQIESINRLIERAAVSPPEKAAKLIMKANDLWLKVFLVKPDAWIARASWLSFYEQSLKKQGIKTSKIDWDTHELNEEAGNYAQRMLDRQQNISDPDEAGKLFAQTDNASATLFTKIVMPFASFRMNQATRLANDLSTFGHWTTSTYEDKVIAGRSLAGYLVEQLTFRTLSATITLLMGNFANSVMGNDDEDEDDYSKRFDNVLKGQITGSAIDLLSPVPILDKGVQGAIYYAADAIQDWYEIEEDEKLNVFKPKTEEFFKGLGLFGITLDRLSQFIELTNLSAFDGNFKDNYGNKKYLNEEDKEGLKKLIGPAILTSIGLLPSDVNTVVRTALKNAKKEATTQEGGMTEEELSSKEVEEAELEQRREDAQSVKDEKVKELKNLLKDEFDPEKIKEIKKKIEYFSMTNEEKREYEKAYKDEIQEEEEELKDLLQGYDNKSDMKRYDPNLYEENFGENSEYYRKNRAKMEVEKELNKELKENEDEEYGYTKKEKRKRYESPYRARKKGKSSYIRRDADGNIIYKSTRSWDK